MALLSTAYFPPVAWFAAALQSDQVTIEAHEHYLKQTWRNRCSILTANGELALSIPVVKLSGQKMPIKSVAISYETDWQRMHWNAIMSAYNKSPYFEHFAHEFEPVFKQKPQFLFEFNLQLMHILFECFGLKIPITESTDFLPLENSLSADFRYLISPKVAFPLDFPEYYQVFGHKFDFVPNLSILDVLFNEGPDGIDYLPNVVVGGQ